MLMKKLTPYIWLLPVFICTACSDDEIFDDGTPPPGDGGIPQTDQYFVEVTFSDTAFLMNEANGFLNVGTNAGIDQPPVCTHFYGAGMNDFDAGQSLTIEFAAHLTLEPCNDRDTFLLAFPTGSYAYAPAVSARGIVVRYRPEAGAPQYITTLGPQDGSTFEVTETTDATVLSSFGSLEAALAIAGHFSCRLYNPMVQGEYIDVEEGSFLLKFESRH